MLTRVMDAAIELMGADFGVVQLRDEASGGLLIVAQRGFSEEFVTPVRQVSTMDVYASARAARSGRRVIVEDVNEDAGYASVPGFAARAGFRSTQATPLHGVQGEVLGVLSTMHRQAHRPQDSDLDLLDLFARHAIERVRATDAARESERRYRSLFNTIDQAFCVVEVLFDAEGRSEDYRFLEVNPVYTQHTGLANSVGKTGRELVSTLEPSWVETFGRVARSGRAERFTDYVQGLNRYFDCYAFRFDVPERRQVAVFFKDVTEQRLTEARDRFLLALDDATRALTEPEAISAAATRLLGEHLHVDRVAYTEVDMDEDHLSIVADYSPRLPSIVGRYRLNDYGPVLLQTLREGRSFVIDDLARSGLSEEERGRYAARQVGAMVQVPLHKDGRLRSTLAVYQSVPRRWRDEDIERVVTVANRCWEAIERARVTRALRDSEEQFRTLANLLPQFIWTARPDGYIYWFNDYAHAFFGPDADIEGLGWTRYHDPELLPEIERGYVEALQAGTPYDCTTRFRNAAGEYRWFMARMVPQRDAQGRVLRFLGYNFDVTELYETQARLVEADRRKDEFLATLAHELRNPLAPLHNVLEIMKLRPDAGIDAGMREMMQRQVHHLGRLVNDLLDASRISRGVVELRREQVRLGEVLGMAIESSRPLIEARGHRLNVETPAEPLWLQADAVRLTQVFANLLNNAARYTEDHGRIDIRARAQDGAAVVSVRDSGIGIAPEMLGRVFELFTQVDRSSGRGQGGLGIGLYLSRSLVQLHGGSLSVASAGFGHGSEFTVRLPLDTSTIAPREAHPQVVNPGAEKGRKLLVVDDNVDAGTTLGMLLDSMGARVRVLHDGAAALEALAREPAAAVFVDLGMPDMDGFEFARRIREQAGGAAPVLIAVTGWGQDEDRERSRQAGFDHHLVKPAELSELEAVMKSLDESGL